MRSLLDFGNSEEFRKKLIENIQRVQKLCFQIASTAISQQATNQKYFITLSYCYILNL
jgi:hypothetical protein